ncbi:branched-chain amino acid ABC transporter permease [Azospirillum picis]|uniref:Branched-chain amino acid transport system permease protein n=1 Tax=Azospirillum picis TaxID=488438 RepID=A0ABU0MNA4_9PROT|nr:branched-chain amino acid ABC transporter permease [Azospirillum picis]MBP2300677.1 branched-chain amino acid transport system permease protein [Azospirillum picis]MDQ0534646.1 branched-chain amino acid transport system permease protein [Azospirillum picis]
MLELLPQQLANGLALGSTYALVAMGLTLIFGVLLIPNFAHGEFYMLGAFITYALVASGLNFWLAMAAAVVLVTGIGWIVDRVVFQPIGSAPGHSAAQGSGLSMMISALAGSIILQQVATIIWGTEARTIPAPMTGVIQTPYFTITALQLTVIGTLTAAWIAVWLVLHRSRLGLAIRATSQNRDAALLMGISMTQVRLATFGIGAALGAVAGALLGATFPIYPSMGVTPVLKAFVVLVIGGIGSLPGAIAGGLVLGMVEVMVAGYGASQFQDIGTFVILVAVLLIRPQGLFGRAQVER